LPRTASATPKNTCCPPFSRRGGEHPRRAHTHPSRPPICASGSPINGAVDQTPSPNARSPRSSATPWTPSAVGSTAAGCNPSKPAARISSQNATFSTSPSTTATASPKRVISTKNCWMPSSGKKTELAQGVRETRTPCALQADVI